MHSSSFVLGLIGATVFLGLMWWVARSHSLLWRRLGAAYAGQARGEPLAVKL